MSRRSPARRKLSRTMFAFVALSLTASMGCWEQWSEAWFPQMKWQKAVGAFEIVTWNDQVAAFLPPEGTVPIDGGEPVVSNQIDAASDVLVNPRVANLESLTNGKKQFEIYCTACHGFGGLGDGAVSMTGGQGGPLAGVLAIAGPTSIARVRSDGHIYTTIRAGRRRMPSYQRIPSNDRWDIVNYIRHLNDPNGSIQ